MEGLGTPAPGPVPIIAVWRHEHGLDTEMLLHGTAPLALVVQFSREPCRYRPDARVDLAGAIEFHRTAHDRRRVKTTGQMGCHRSGTPHAGSNRLVEQGTEEEERLAFRHVRPVGKRSCMPVPGARPTVFDHERSTRR